MMRPRDPRLADPRVVLLAAKRLAHRQATGTSPYPLDIRYVGEEGPERPDALRSLVIVLHRPWCQDAWHSGPCAPETEEAL